MGILVTMIDIFKYWGSVCWISNLFHYLNLLLGCQDT